MPVYLTQITEGLTSGLKSRHKGFLALLAISVSLVPAMVLATMIMTKQPLTWAFVTSFGPTLWVSLVFSAYLASIACRQHYQRCRGDSEAFSALARQVDVVVSAMLFALLITGF